MAAARLVAVAISRFFVFCSSGAIPSNPSIEPPLSCVNEAMIDTAAAALHASLSAARSPPQGTSTIPRAKSETHYALPMSLPNCTDARPVRAISGAAAAPQRDKLSLRGGDGPRRWSRGCAAMGVSPGKGAWDDAGVGVDLHGEHGAASQTHHSQRYGVQKAAHRHATCSRPGASLSAAYHAAQHKEPPCQPSASRAPARLVVLVAGVLRVAPLP